MTGAGDQRWYLPVLRAPEGTILTLPSTADIYCYFNGIECRFFYSPVLLAAVGSGRLNLKDKGCACNATADVKAKKN